MILTEEEIKAIGVGAEKFARAVEAAVLEKLRQQEPAAFAILSDSGNAVRIWWSGAERARAERIAARDFPGIPLVALYAAPVPAAVPEGWKLVPVEATAAMKSAGADALDDKDAATSLRADAANTYRAMLSAAPAAPAVPAVPAVLDDAERYRWLRDRLSIEDIDRIVSEFFGTPDEAESVKTDAAIDAAMQKGGATC